MRTLGVYPKCVQIRGVSLYRAASSVIIITCPVVWVTVLKTIGTANSKIFDNKFSTVKIANYTTLLYICN